MATLGKWSGGATSLLPGTTWAAPNALFPTQDRNDASAYTWTSSTSTVQIPASGLPDGYLFVGAFEFEDDSNGRHNPQAQIVQASGTGNFVGAPTSGYNRDTSEDRSYVRCWAFVDNPSASATFQFQWKRDADTPTGGTERSEFQVIPLWYGNHGIYSSTTAALYGGTSINQVTGWSAVDESDTGAIELATNVVTLKTDNKRYLVLGSQFYEGYGASRTQRWYGLEIDGAKEDAAKGYAYSRNASNDEVGEFYTWLVDRVTTNITVESFAYRGDGVSNGQGGADVDGSTPTVGDHALVVLELHDGAEVFRSQSSTNSSDLSSSPTALNCNENTDFNDAASFTDVANTSINCVKTADYLFGANVSVASNNVSTGSRWTAFAEYTVNGTNDPDSVAGDYMRNNQSSQDTFGWSANLLGFQGITAGDDVGVEVTELTGSEGGGNGISPAGWTGFWGINLDTLEPASDPTITDVETDEEIDDKQTAVTITGTNFEAVQGTGKVEISDNATYGSGNVVAQTVTSWGATAIDITVVLGAMSPGTPRYVWVTNDTGDRNTSGFVVHVHRAQAFKMSASSNIAASGENSTRQLTIPATKVGGDFDGGRAQDDENPGDTVDLTVSGFREDEWSIEATTNAEGVQYQFRVILSGVDLGDITFTVDPRVTISVGYTLTADSGSYTLTGAAADVEASRVLDAASGSYTLGGTAVELVSTKIIAGESGAYVITGTAADLEAQRMLDAGFGSYVLSGIAAELVASRLLEADAGAYTLTGAAALLLASLDLDAESGVYTLTGSAAELLRTLAMSADSGTYALTGQVADLMLTLTLAADSGAYVLTGTAVDLLRDLTLVGESGTYTVNGAAAELVRSITLDAESGTYVVSGQDAQLLRALVFDAESGTYTLTGTAVALLKTLVLDAEAGAYTLTGADVELMKTFLLDAASGGYILTGAAAEFFRQTRLGADSGAYVISGSDAELNKGVILIAGGGAYSLAGEDVDFSRALVLAGDTGSYVVTGADTALTKSVIMPADSGSYVLSGSIADLIFSVVLEAETGTYSITGNPVEFKRSLVMAADAGGYILSGTAAALLQAATVSADSGSYVVSGATVELLRALLLDGESGAYVLSGTDVTLTLSNVFTLEANSGTYTITGQDVEFVRSLIAVADAGTYTLTGADAGLKRSVVLVGESGTYTLTGAAAELILGFVMPADSGAYTITGAGAELLRDLRMVSDTGAYTLHGTEADLERALVMEADSGTYVLTGAGVEFVVGLSMVAASGTYIITGQDVELPRDYVLNGDAGAYALTGADVDLNRSVILTGESGTYAYTGQDAEMLRGFILSGEPGVYSVAGQDVAFLRGHVLAAAAGAYSLDGTVVDLTRAVIMIAEPGAYLITGADANLVSSSEPIIGREVTIMAGSTDLNVMPNRLRTIARAGSRSMSSARKLTITRSGDKDITN